MRRNPWDMMRELSAMHERMNRMCGNIYERGDEDVTSRGTWLPPVDIYETEGHAIVLKAELPGLKREDIDLTVENNTLTIRGQRRRDDGIPDDRYHRLERHQGSFSRSFTLPNTVDTGRVKAEYREGVLTVTLPTREEARPHQIHVDLSE